MEKPKKKYLELPKYLKDIQIKEAEMEVLWTKCND